MHTDLKYEKKEDIPDDCIKCTRPKMTDEERTKAKEKGN